MTAASPGTSCVVTTPPAETSATGSAFDWNRASRVTSFSVPSVYFASTFSCWSAFWPMTRSAGSTRSDTTCGASGDPSGVPAAIQSRSVR